MSELSKKDIAEIFTEQLEPFAVAIHKDFEQVKEDIAGVGKRLDRVENRLDRVENRLDRVEQDVAEVKADVKWMKENSNELFIKLDRFIALYEKQEQELAMLGVQVRRLEDRMDRLENSGSQTR